MFREGRQIQKNTNSIENSHCFFQRFFNEKRAKIDEKLEKNAQFGLNGSFCGAGELKLGPDGSTKIRWIRIRAPFVAK